MPQHVPRASQIPLLYDAFALQTLCGMATLQILQAESHSIDLLSIQKDKYKISPGLC